MRTRSRSPRTGPGRLAAALLLLGLGLGESAAQLRPGDAVFGGTPMTVIHRDGTFATLAALPGRSEITAITQAADGDGLLVAVTAFPAPPVLAVFKQDGLVKTLYRSWTLPTPWELLPDSTGNVVVVGTTLYGQTAFGDLRPGGEFKLVYEAALESGANAHPLRAALDPHTDEVLAVTPTGEVLKIEREDPIHVTTISVSSAYAYPGGIRPHPRADRLLVEGVGGDFYAVNRFTGVKTRVYRSPSSDATVVGWDVDPFLNALVVFRQETAGHGVLFRVDLDTGVSTVVRDDRVGPEPRPMALAETRILSWSGGRAEPGSAYEMRVRFPDNPGGVYVTAASFSPTPGFELEGRHIPLDLQPLVPFSLCTPSIFEAFAGVLDAAGEGFPRLHVPKEAAGVRVYFATLSLRGGSIHGVSRPFGVTIAGGPTDDP
jgi:hypothetical protein